VEQSFFEQVLDALAGSVPAAFGQLHSYAHRRGLKVWFDEPHREHYEAQLVQVDGAQALEIGFHAEHPNVAANQAVISRLTAEPEWRAALGDEPVAGEFLGRSTWRRVSESWPVPEADDIDAAIEVAARLADYIAALEPLRRAASRA
jgi:hypothetical protein